MSVSMSSLSGKHLTRRQGLSALQREGSRSLPSDSSPSYPTPVTPSVSSAILASPIPNGAHGFPRTRCIRQHWSRCISVGHPSIQIQPLIGRSGNLDVMPLAALSMPLLLVLSGLPPQAQSLPLWHLLHHPRMLLHPLRLRRVGHPLCLH